MLQMVNDVSTGSQGVRVSGTFSLLSKRQSVFWTPESPLECDPVRFIVTTMPANKASQFKSVTTRGAAASMAMVSASLANALTKSALPRYFA